MHHSGKKKATLRAQLRRNFLYAIVFTLSDTSVGFPRAHSVLFSVQGLLAH